MNQVIATLLTALLLAFPNTVVAQGEQPTPCSTSDLGRDTSEQLEGLGPLDGRIGSSRDAFESIYGSPISDDVIFVEYEIPECGTVYASYHDESGTLVGLNVYSPRTEDSELEKAHPADWTLDEAELIAASFAPPDAIEADRYEIPAPRGYTRIDIYSDELLEVPGEAFEYVDNDPNSGMASIVLWLTNDNTVSWITIDLSIEDPPTVD